MALTSYEAETAVIATAMMNNNMVEKLCDIIEHTHFSDGFCGLIWGAVSNLSMRGEKVDMITVDSLLGETPEYIAGGGLASLGEVSRNGVGYSNALEYAKIIADLHDRRQFVHNCREMAVMADDKGYDFSELVDMGQGRLAGLVNKSKVQIGPIGQFLGDDVIEDLSRKWEGEVSAMGVSFGNEDLDRMTMGMHGSQLIIIGARPKMGKTMFAMNAIRSCILKDKKPCVMFSMEMGRKELTHRLTASIANIPQDAMKDPKNHMTDEMWPRVTMAIQELKDAPLVIDDRPALRPSQIRSQAKRWMQHYGELGLIIVDYIGLMSSDGKHENRVRELTEISGALKALSKELGVPVMALSQLNRSLEQRPNKRPMMSDLRESGSIEQDADVITFLYADEQYNEDTPMKGVIEFIVAAQRSGPTGTAYAWRKLSTGRFEDIDPDALAGLQQDAARAQQPKRGKSALDSF